MSSIQYYKIATTPQVNGLVYKTETNLDYFVHCPVFENETKNDTNNSNIVIVISIINYNEYPSFMNTTQSDLYSWFI